MLTLVIICLSPYLCCILLLLLGILSDGCCIIYLDCSDCVIVFRAVVCTFDVCCLMFACCAVMLIFSPLSHHALPVLQCRTILLLQILHLHRLVPIVVSPSFGIHSNQRPVPCRVRTHNRQGNTCRGGELGWVGLG